MLGRSPQSNILDVVLDLLADKIAARLQGVAPVPAAASRLLNVKEAATRMGCSASSVRHMIQTGALPQRALRRFGRRVLIEREEFDRWVSAH